MESYAKSSARTRVVKRKVNETATGLRMQTLITNTEGTGEVVVKQLKCIDVDYVLLNACKLRAVFDAKSAGVADTPGT